ncbi:MAG: hypothetical protein ACYC61_21925 [Isosphaeraceae bacterium]
MVHAHERSQTPRDDGTPRFGLGLDRDGPGPVAEPAEFDAGPVPLDNGNLDDHRHDHGKVRDAPFVVGPRNVLVVPADSSGALAVRNEVDLP